VTVQVVSDHRAAKAPGRLSKALLGLFMKRAAIAAVEDVADGFRLVTLRGAALEGVSWVPGRKVQVAMGSAFVARTYTPLDWDAAAGSTRILGYAHGGGPGSAWLRGLRGADGCELFGPRSSLDTGGATLPLAAFGDETSIGLAYALASTNRLDPMRCCFEVNDIRSASQVLARLGLEQATLVGKRGDDAHLSDLEAALGPTVAAGGSFVLTGKASTIQLLRQNLRWEGVSTGRILTKAYWAPGKRGLD
jgi:NADPH-dependent ferric siderophore reductase